MSRGRRIEKHARALIDVARKEAEQLGIGLEVDMLGRHPKLILTHGDKRAVVPFASSPRTDNQAIRGRQNVHHVARKWGLM